MRRVLYLLRWFSPEVYQGVLQYANERKWHLNSGYLREKRVPVDWDGDGIIAGTLIPHENARPYWEDPALPKVFITPLVDDKHIPSIQVNHARLAACAFEYFVGRSFKRILTYHSNSVPGNLRHDEMVRLCRGHGIEHRSLKRRSGWKTQLVDIQSELQHLEKPVAVFATEDPYVSEVVEACFLAGMLVPEDVAILGTNNDSLCRHYCGISISSIESNHFELGYEAAKILDRQMEGYDLPVRPHTVLMHDPKVVERLSTDIVAVDHPGIAKALKYAKENFRVEIGIDELARAAGMSQSGLFQGFAEYLGRTPGKELERLRLAEAKRLLRETKDDMETVAFSAGFQTAQNMYLAFKRTLKMTPSKYRKGKRNP